MAGVSRDTTGGVVVWVPGGELRGCLVSENGVDSLESRS